MPGGILFESDWDRLRSSVRRIAAKFSDTPEGACFFLEIGIESGQTSRDLMKEINDVYEHFFYWGIDPFASDPKIGDPRFIFVSKFIYECNFPKLHWIFVDGCHCYNCVARDLANCAPLLANGGELLFHDASPLMQGRDPQIYVGSHHDIIEAEKGIQVRRVLDKIMPHRSDLKLVIPAPADQQFGGVEIYKKV